RRSGSVMIELRRSDRAKKKTKALLLCLDFPPVVGGIQTMLGNLAGELTALDLTVVAPSAPRAAEHDRRQGYRVLRARAAGSGARGRRFLPAIAAQAAWLGLTQRPDILLCGHAALGPIAAAIRRTLGIPYAVLAYDVEFRHPRLRRFLPRIFAGANR